MERKSRIGDTLLSITVVPATVVEVVVEEVAISMTVDCFPNSVFLSSRVRLRFVGFGDVTFCFLRE